jgi:hypothetical protein
VDADSVLDSDYIYIPKYEPDNSSEKGKCSKAIGLEPIDTRQHPVSLLPYGTRRKSFLKAFRTAKYYAFKYNCKMIIFYLSKRVDDALADHIDDIVAHGVSKNEKHISYWGLLRTQSMFVITFPLEATSIFEMLIAKYVNDVSD